MKEKKLCLWSCMVLGTTTSQERNRGKEDTTVTTHPTASKSIEEG